MERKQTYGGDISSESRTTDLKWYNKPAKEMHASVFSWLEQQDGRQLEENNNIYKYMRMYSSMPAMDIKTRSSMPADIPNKSSLPRMTLNVVKSAIDTVHSKMIKNMPKPMFLTNGGDWCDQRKAKNLNKFIEGQYYETGAYTHAGEVLLHSLITGTGCLKIWNEGADIKMEPVLIDEIYVDKYEGLYGKPRQLHQTKLIHREVLTSMFPKFKNQIASAKSNPLNSRQTPNDNTDMLLVVESWRLPEGDTPGKHAITIENATLLSEDYRRDEFPFVFLRWRKLPFGFSGQGIPEEIKGIQVEINKLLNTIQLAIHLGAVPKVLVENGSKVSIKAIDNRIGGVINYSGTPPTAWQLGKVPVELFNQLEWLYNKAWEILGISALSAISQKPAGLDSGKALREYNDIESERFMAFGKAYEEFHMSISKHLIELSKTIAETEGDMEVKAPGKGSFELLKWSEVSMDEDKYIMQAYPTSALSRTPSARLNEVSDLMNLGFVGKEQAMKLLDFPDIEALYKYETSAEDDIDRTIDLIVEKGEYEAPEPFQNLQLGVKRMQQAYLIFKGKNLEEEKLEMLRMWIVSAQEMLQPPVPMLPPEAAALPAAAPVEPGMEEIAAQIPPGLPIA